MYIYIPISSTHYILFMLYRPPLIFEGNLTNTMLLSQLSLVISSPEVYRQVTKLIEYFFNFFLLLTFANLHYR